MARNKFFSILSLLLIAAFAGFAQPGGGRPPGGGSNPPCQSPPCNPVPISGIEVLLLMGGALGFRSLVKRKNK